MSDTQTPVTSLEAETGVLGGLLHLAQTAHPADARDTVLDLRAVLPPEAFYFAGHRIAYEQINTLAEAEKQFDPISLVQAMVDAGHSGAGGQVGERMNSSARLFITELAMVMPTASLIRQHADIVLRKHIRREIHRNCFEVLAKVHDEQDGDEHALLDEVQSRMLAISERHSSEENFRKPQAGVVTAMARLHAAHDNKGGITGMPSGLLDLDRMTTGWKGGQMIVVAGSTGMGKTSLMLQCAAHLAIHCDTPVAFFSLEMGYDEIIERMLYAEARVSLQRARDGLLSDDLFHKFGRVAEKVARANLYVDDFPGLNAFEFRSRARRAVKKFGCKAIFGDYLQLFEGDGDSKETNRVMELQRVSRAMKLTAKSLDVAVIVGAQLNRKPDERKSSVVVDPYAKDEEGKPIKKQRYGIPQLGDLRECGAIGQDADLVMAPYRPYYWSHLEEDCVNNSKHVEHASIIMMKQRNGPVGSIPVRFINDETRFETIPDEQGHPRTTLYGSKQRQPGFEAAGTTEESDE